MGESRTEPHRTIVRGTCSVKDFPRQLPFYNSLGVGFIDCMDATHRSVILHDHLFKNAGSTIDWAVRRCFGRAFVEQVDPQARGSDFVRAALGANPPVSAISTHRFRPPLPVIADTRVFTLMMFRDPLERAVSIYHFNRRRLDRDDRSAVAARSMSLRKYIVWSMQPGLASTLCNFHVIKCHEETFNDPEAVGEGHLETAKRYIASLPLVGSVDQFDDSMVLFEHVLRDAFPSIDLSYVKQNAGPRLTWRNRDKAAVLREALGDTLFDELRQRNAYDLEVVSFARETLRRRIAEVPDIERARSDFQSRCRNRQGLWSRCRRAISERIRSM